MKKYIRISSEIVELISKNIDGSVCVIAEDRDSKVGFRDMIKLNFDKNFEWSYTTKEKYLEYEKNSTDTRRNFY